MVFLSVGTSILGYLNTIYIMTKNTDSKQGKNGNLVEIEAENQILMTIIIIIHNLQS